MHSPTTQGALTVHGLWEALHAVHGGQRSISPEYQTYTFPHPFDTLVTGMATANFPIKERVVHKEIGESFDLITKVLKTATK